MVELKLISKASKSEPHEILSRLIKEEKLPVTIENINGILKKDSNPSQWESQAISIMLFLELRKNEKVKGWHWIRGINKKDKEKTILHSWLEFKDWVIDPMPGFRFKDQEIFPGNILIMDKADFKKKTGFTIMSKRNEKQTMKWIEKNNKKHGRE